MLIIMLYVKHVNTFKQIFMLSRFEDFIKYCLENMFCVFYKFMYFTSASIWWYFRAHLVGDVKALIIVLCYALQFCVAFVCNSMMLMIFSVTFLYVYVFLT
jgi:hypothetical protein